MFADRLAEVRKNIDAAMKKAGRTDSVEVVAVSKYYPAEAILDAYGCGHRIFGESRVQEAVEKKEILKDLTELELHFIGHLQTNKVKYLEDIFGLIHSVDSERLADELNRYFNKIDRVQDILVQVNIANDPDKSGVTGEEAESLCNAVKDMPNLNLRGLMMIPPLTDNEEKNRKYFTAMKELFDKLSVKNENTMDILSMGMSDDYTIAVEEGSTMVRIGTALFGGR
ncbi:MAG: YggS family pyridoxal phosphate-dependent enzyme [Deferribacterales bacterium]